MTQLESSQNEEWISGAELGRRIGKDASQLCRWKKAGMPNRSAGGKPLYQESACRAWLQSAGIRVGAQTPVEPLVIDPKPNRELDEEERRLVSVLGSAESAPSAKAAAAYALACKRVARGYEEGSLGPGQFENLKKQSEELRRVESDFISLAERRGQLIEREIACAVAGQIALRLIAILNVVENSIATQFEIWLMDEKLKSLPTEQRGRQIRQWFADQARSLRELEARTIEEMIQAEIAERA